MSGVQSSTVQKQQVNKTKHREKHSNWRSVSVRLWHFYPAHSWCPDFWATPWLYIFGSHIITTSILLRCLLILFKAL